TEISPSGHGVKIICRASLPPGGRKQGNFECYDSGHFFALTGDHLEGTPAEPEPRQDVVSAIYAEIFGTPTAQQEHPALPHAPVTALDKALIQHALPHITADDYGTWIAVGMGLQYGLGDAGFALWEAWSRSSHKFEDGACRDKWRSFRGARADPVALG